MIYKQFLFLLVFATVVYGLYFAFPAKYRYIVLLSASVIFSFILSGAVAAFTLLAALFIYVFARAMTKNENAVRAEKSSLSKDEFKALKKKVKKKNSIIAAVAVTCVLAVLLVLKYISFFEEIISGAAGIFGAELNLPVLKFALPLGISYYTLSAVGYLIDVKRGKYAAEENFFKLALFLFYFPALLEGPVARYDVTGIKLCEGHSFDFDNLKRGILLILFGLFKKIVVADRLAILVGAVFSSYADYSGITVLVSVVAFTFQLYAEFSGIIDIAAGVSKMYGIPLEKNFDHPFFSLSVGEFWRRWHISLGSWFKDYVFYPVSMSKMSKKLSSFLRKKNLSPFLQTFVPSLISLFAVWSLTGLWHGASVKYLVYGLYYYAVMMLETLFAHIFAGKKFLSSKPYPRYSRGRALSYWSI